MKLMKLLTVGRSFRGGKPGLGTYKLQQILLPKFSSSVRPSKTANARAAVPLPELAIPAPTPTPLANIGRSLEPASLGMDKTQKIPAGKILKRKPEPTGISLKVKVVGLLQKQISALKKRLFPIRSKKKTGATPLQAEWNLEKVTVARNDLSEADLEIVTPKATRAIPRKLPLPNLGRVKNSGRQWIKMTTRLFKTSSPFEMNANAKPTQVAERRELTQRI